MLQKLLFSLNHINAPDTPGLRMAFIDLTWSFGERKWPLEMCVGCACVGDALAEPARRQVPGPAAPLVVAKLKQAPLVRARPNEVRGPAGALPCLLGRGHSFAS